MLDRLAFLHQLPVLLKGTSDDDTPCPGYLYEEIARISHDSAGSGQCLLEYLLNRLQNNSCRVKLKPSADLQTPFMGSASTRKFDLQLRNLSAVCSPMCHRTAPPCRLLKRNPQQEWVPRCVTPILCKDLDILRINPDQEGPVKLCSAVSRGRR